MLAVSAAAADASVAEITAILAQRDRASVAAAVLALDPETAGEIRWLFTSFGTCSTKEPVADLVSLGLLSQH
jgi:DNA-directed RNA polymerase subunit F